MTQAATEIGLSLIVRDMELQPRAKMDHARVTQYAEDMLADIPFPPVVVYFDGDEYWLSEGFHRCAAAAAVGEETILCEIREGSREDALWNSAGSNKEWDADHAGKRRLNEDKDRAVKLAFQAKPKANLNAIAVQTGVDWRRVKKIREDMFCNAELVKSGKIEVLGNNGESFFRSATNDGYDREPGEDDDDEPFTLNGDPDVAPILATISNEVKPHPKPTFNITNEMVDWARWTWNPVTGCEHTCAYCYARDIANRFYPEKFAPTFRPERLDAPIHTALPGAVTFEEDPIQRTAWRNCFVCSMADLFGRWVPDEWIKAVFRSCRNSPQWNYLFLTKFPQRYPGLDFPGTSWVGTTVDEQKRVVSAEKAFRKIDVPVKWLSVEPMLEPIKFSDLRMFDWVVIGGQSRNSECPEFFPDPRWVLDLTDQAIASGCKVYWKENVSPRKGLFKEYPAAFTE